MPGAFGAKGTSRFLSSEDYFSEYRKFFEAKGCAVGRAEFPPDISIEGAAGLLRAQAFQFIAAHPGFTITLVAHSQGALDARMALKWLGLSGVRNLIAIGAPMRGTPVADWVVKQRTGKRFFYWAFRLLAHYDFNALQFAGELTGEFLRLHADKFEDVPGIRYAAAVGLCRTGCFLPLELVAWWIGVGPGDGMIPADSQRSGEDLGEYDLDHLSEAGVDGAKRPERQRLLERMWKFMEEDRK